MNMKPIIVSLLGWSGSGKTTFIESAIQECASRGIFAAAVKKSRHSADLPPDTKDSARFRAAGASPSIYVSESEMVILAAPPLILSAEALIALCPHAEIIFCEGLEVGGAVIVLLTGEEKAENALKRPLSDIDAVIARGASMLELAAARNIKAFKPEAVGLFIDYLIAMEDANVR